MDKLESFYAVANFKPQMLLNQEYFFKLSNED